MYNAAMSLMAMFTAHILTRMYLTWRRDKFDSMDLMSTLYALLGVVGIALLVAERS